MSKKLGILMLDTIFERIPGDVGNPASYPFEIIKKVVTGAKADQAVGGADLLAPFLAAAKELEEEGVTAITTSCGFLAKYQNDLSNAVSVPFFASSLLQIRYLWPLIGKTGKIGVMAASSTGITEAHLKGADIEGIPIVVCGMEGTYFNEVFVTETKPLNVDIVKAEVLSKARQMVSENPDIKLIVLECTVMPPYAKDIQEATGLPVYDITTLASYVMSGFGRTSF